MATALKQTQSFLQGIVGTDDELTEAVFSNDPRVIVNLKVFLQHLSTNDAVCSVETMGKTFGSEDVSSVRHGLKRLSQENVRKEPKTFAGEFQGMIPKWGTFQFKPSDSQNTIIGKVGEAITDPTSINDNLNRTVTIDTIETRVGSGRPRYVLSSLPIW